MIERGGGGGPDIAVSKIEGYSHDHLLTAKQRVADELARAQGDGGVGVSHFRG